MPASLLWLALLLFAAPFWEQQPSAAWTLPQVQELLADSPWARPMLTPGKGQGMPAIQSYLATAGPIRQAEQELERHMRLRQPSPEVVDPFAEEYRLWLEEFRPTQVVLAIRIQSTMPYSEVKELQRLEEESFLFAGRRKIPITGYFPPTAADPFLRVAFPRKDIQAADKVLRFEIYVPGVTGPFREVEYSLEALRFGGKLEF